MASAPRPGRKGGKIESPAVAPAAAARTPPSEMKLPREASEQLPEQPQGSSTAFQFDASSAFLQFDPTAIDLVGKGAVMGGAKHVRMEQRSATVDTEEVIAKLELFLTHVTYRPTPAQGTEAGAQATTAAAGLLQEFDVVVSTLAEGVAVTAAIAGSGKPSNDACILVVVPSYFVVDKTVAHLRNVCGTPDVVGSLVGATMSGATDATRVWVADAKTALGIFAQQQHPNPITHVVFYKSRIQQPSVQLVLAAIKQSETFRGKLLFAGGTLAANVQELESYVAPRTVTASPAVQATAPHQVESMNLEEACALVEADVVSVSVDRTGRFPGPHPKIAEHTLQLCVSVIQKIVHLSKSPQVIVVYTADVGETLSHIQSTSVGKYVVDRDELTLPSDDNVLLDHVGEHRVHVFSYCDQDEGRALNATVVIDKGTMKMSWVPSPAEAAFPCKRTEWQSREEQTMRKTALLGWSGVGMYISLYPREAEDVFPAKTAAHLELVDMEGALLQCSRAKAIVSPERLMTPFPKESILRAMVELSESGAIVSADHLGFTFTGEIFHRLPTLTDVSSVVLNGVILGIEEAAIAVAAVSTLHVFAHKLDPKESNGDWIARVSKTRMEQTGGKATSSDVLADAMIALKWLHATLLAPSDADALAAAIGVPTNRLRSIADLMSHMREQLTDYAFLDSFKAAADVERTIASLNAHWDSMTILMSVACCRKSVVVRNDGQISARDTSGNMMFLRTPKTAMPSAYAPSCVTWKVGNAVVGAAVLNSSQSLYIKDMTTMQSNYYLASLVLLAPAIDYSAPQTAPDGAYVYMSMSANGQAKRVKVAIEGAARILEFRDKWNLAYGCVMALRALPRNTSVSQFAQYIQTRNKSVHLKTIQQELQDELWRIADEVRVVEDNRTFPQTSTHRFMPAGDLVDAAMQVSSPSDEDAIRQFCTKTYAVNVPSGGTSEAVAATDEAGAGRAVGGSSPMPLVEDDDVETTQSYFAQHGPLIEDDDDDDA